MSKVTEEENVITAGAEENALPAAETASQTIADGKFRRIVVALTVGAVVLLSLLVILMCYQMIKIGVERGKKAELNAKIAELTELTGEKDKELEYLRTEKAIERLARELGYHYADDVG